MNIAHDRSRSKLHLVKSLLGTFGMFLFSVSINFVTLYGILVKSHRENAKHLTTRFPVLCMRIRANCRANFTRKV